jgi:hypothetical protein
MPNNTFTPPEGVRSAAKRALKWIADGKAGSGFTSVGHTRATQLANGENISLETLNRMKSFFSRHEVDKKATGFNEGEQGFPSHGRVAWDAWGGNAGFAWAKSKVAEAENSMDKSVDIAPRLVELSVDKLRSLHERLHKSEASPATLEVHHLTTTEMARRGMELPSNDEWENVRIEIDYFEDIDLESFSSTLPAEQIEEVIKATGTSVADVRMVLTSIGYAMEIVPDNSVEKMIKHEKGKWVVYDHSGMHPLGTYDTKDEAANRIAEIEYFRKYNQNHDPANGEFSSGPGGAGASGADGGESITGKPGSNSYSNQVADSLVAGGTPSIDAKDVGKFLNTMANRGDNPDITNLKVNGHTLFGGDGLGIKRSEMPQIPIKMRKQFIQDMADQGVSTELKKVDAMDLKPSQSEISATKTARLYQHFKSDGIPKDKAILVSKDGFVVDGHHHWAAAAAMGLMGNKSTIPVIQMDLNIKDAISAAKAWSDSHGIAAQDINSAELPIGKSSDESDYFMKFNPNHDDHGRFSTATGGGGVPALAADIAPTAARSPEAVAEAKALRQRAAALEPGVTQIMVDLLKQSGGVFATLPDGTDSLAQRLKSTDSLARKIDGDAKKEFKDDKKAAAAAVSDAIRYTALVPEGSYADGLSQTIKTLEAAGFKLRTKNFWQTGDPYDGVNIKALKNGIQVELQIHTPTSYQVKEVKLHDIYEVYRESPINSVRRASWDKMVEIAKTIPRPANYLAVLGVGTLITQQFETAQQAGLIKSTPVDILLQIERGVEV